MPGILPKEKNKIIVRPRGGLNLAKTSAITVMTAIRTAASLTRAETMYDTQCPNVQQNIMVISTPDDLRARKYAGVKEINIEDRTYEVSAYAAAPDGAVKGVVRGIPMEDSAETITDNILNARNINARAAQRIGSSTTIIVVFECPKVPNFVYYGGGLLRCTLYRKHYEVCRGCGKVGHRVDVCPTPETKVCIGCGEKTDRDHQCTPKWKPPGIEYLRPISLTSCVGKVLEHVLMNRWQRYLEDEGLFPNAMYGFREMLCTQDAMALIKKETRHRAAADQGETGEGPDPTSMDLMARVANLCDTVAQRLVLADHGHQGQGPRPQVPVPLYTGYDDRKSVADFLAELAAYKLATGASDDHICHAHEASVAGPTST
ncbi:hypothetical protein ISCGN_016225 [Ixodes scapularis]